jgi:prophage antirepressor-like protein
MSNLPVPSNSRNVSVFSFEGSAVRSLLDDEGEPLFVASDVCKVLGISDVKQAVERLDDDERGRYSVPSGGGMQSTTCITESGLYSLILTSRKSEAKTFKRWITHEVLPAIRKTGSYSLQTMTPAEAFLQIAQNMLAVERQIAEIHEWLGDQAQHIEAIDAELLDRDYYSVKQWCQKQRIPHTPSILQKWGKAAVELSRARSIEIKDASEGSYTVNRYHKSVLHDICVAKPKTSGQLPLPKS